MQPLLRNYYGSRGVIRMTSLLMFLLMIIMTVAAIMVVMMSVFIRNSWITTSGRRCRQILNHSVFNLEKVYSVH